MTELFRSLINWLSTYYWIEVATLALHPVGADVHATIYKVQDRDQKTYFVKLKQGLAQNTSIAIVELLQRAGVTQLIVPIKTVEGSLFQQIDNYTLIVYPFVEGIDGFTTSLNDAQWIALGQTLKQLHQIDIPTSLKAHIRQEEFSPKWRNVIRSLYTHIDTISTTDAIGLQLWEFLKNHQSLIQKLVHRSEQLSQQALQKPLTFVLCHSDIHGGNVLINGGDLYIVDWDDPILAPKERDLMFIGGGVGNVWNQPHEEKLFYQGYGQTNIDQTLLAYYRYERIVEDIAVYSEQLLLSPTTDAQDRLEMYTQFMSLFEPHGVIDIALATDKQVFA